LSKDSVRRRWPSLSILSAALLLSFALGLAVYALVIWRTAKSMLRDTYALTVGVSSTADIERLAKRHANILREQSCGPAKCVVAFEVNNTWLYRLNLEPAARFRVSVETENGTVSYIEITLMRDTRVFPTSASAGMTREYRQIPEALFDFSEPPYWFPTPVGKPYLRVELTGDATVAQREHAYAYSFKCLIKPGNECDLPCDYLPLAWRDWQAQLEKQGFGEGGFGRYYPNRGRCK
jgi:hypothetical protein